jgi:hypothetical protein
VPLYLQWGREIKGTSRFCNPSCRGWRVVKRWLTFLLIGIAIVAGALQEKVNNGGIVWGVAMFSVLGFLVGWFVIDLRRSRRR